MYPKYTELYKAESRYCHDIGPLNFNLGYKIYDYHRESLKDAHQFSPFFVGMKISMKYGPICFCFSNSTPNNFNSF